MSKMKECKTKMKKKVVFMVINMNIGGTEKALLNMIAEMPEDEYDITILMLEKYGGFLDSIPNSVHVKYLEGYRDIKGLLNNPPKKMALSLLKKGKIIRGVNFISAYLMAKVTNNKGIFFKYILKDNFSLENEYDVAVAYAGPMDFISYFVSNKIKAKKRIQWIHFDVTKIGFDKTFAAKVYQQFDNIFVVSKAGKDVLVKILPNIADKIDTFPNRIAPKLILKMANEGNGFEDRFDGIRILTVGRLSKEKGQDLSISVLAKLKDRGFNTRWYCIGEGYARTEYEKKIKEYGLENDFILLGSKSNPYPFMNQCDIYVQPSRHEGYCITLAEAKHFGRPIVCTDFTGASEQIIKYYTGLIVQFNELQMYNALIQLINDKELRNRIKENLKKETVDITDTVDLLQIGERSVSTF